MGGDGSRATTRGAPTGGRAPHSWPPLGFLFKKKKLIILFFLMKLKNYLIWYDKNADETLTDVVLLDRKYKEEPTKKKTKLRKDNIGKTYKNRETYDFGPAGSAIVEWLTCKHDFKINTVECGVFSPFPNFLEKHIPAEHEKF